MSTSAAAEAGVPDTTLAVPARTLSAGAGWDWVVGGWGLFTRAPLMWVIAIVVLFVVAVVLNLVPIIGSLAFQLLQPVIAAGFVAGCRSLEMGGELEIEHLVAGFSKRFGSLLIVGFITMLGWIVIFVVFLGFVGLSILSALLAGNPDMVLTALATSATTMLLGLLVVALLAMPLMAAYWFAPALVMLNDMKPLEAMKASFFACFRNFLPFLVYSVVMTVAVILAIIPLGLGMLVWIPLTIASTYIAYRQIFTEP